MYKESHNLTVKEPNNPIRKWAKDMERNFTKEDIAMKRCSISLDMKGVQIKTMMRYYYTHIRIAKMKTIDNV